MPMVDLYGYKHANGWFIWFVTERWNIQVVVDKTTKATTLIGPHLATALADDIRIIIAEIASTICYPIK